MNAPIWYCARMPSVDVQAGRHIARQHQFETVFRHLSGKHNDVAAYSSGFQGAILTLYSSPTTIAYAAPFLRQIRAEACDQPADVEGFLMGHTGNNAQALESRKLRSMLR